MDKGTVAAIIPRRMRAAKRRRDPASGCSRDPHRSQKPAADLDPSLPGSPPACDPHGPRTSWPSRGASGAPAVESVLQPSVHRVELDTRSKLRPEHLSGDSMARFGEQRLLRGRLERQFFRVFGVPDPAHYLRHRYLARALRAFEPRPRRILDAGSGHVEDDLADRKSTRLNSSHSQQSRMPSSA